jgi:hypothetical protein
MTEATSGTPVCISRLILVPGLITLAITVLRLVGELQQWSKVLFNSAAGGGGAIIGIVWLVPVFGIYFALKLSRTGQGPVSRWRPIAYAMLGLLVMVSGVFVAYGAHFTFAGNMVVGYLIMAAAVIIQIPAWPALAKTLLAYAYAARIPVAVLMFFAIRGNWGTHYDAPPPEFPVMSFWPRYLQIGLLPQLIFWVAFTVVVGALFGAIVTAIAWRPKPAAQAAS